MLRKQSRFHGHNSLNFVHQKGRVVRSAGLNVKYIRNIRQDHFRVAVVVSKKVSKSAVVRNRLRRRLFEAVRTQITLVEPHDIVFIVYDAALATMPSVEQQQQVRRLLTQAHLL